MSMLSAIRGSNMGNSLTTSSPKAISGQVRLPSKQGSADAPMRSALPDTERASPEDLLDHLMAEGSSGGQGTPPAIRRSSILLSTEGSSTRASSVHLSESTPTRSRSEAQIKGLSELRSTTLEYNRTSRPGGLVSSKSQDLGDSKCLVVPASARSDPAAGDGTGGEGDAEWDQTEVTPDEAAAAMRFWGVEWHEVSLSPFTNPFTGEPCVLLSQSDATGRAETEAILTRLNEVCDWHTEGMNRLSGAFLAQLFTYITS